MRFASYKGFAFKKAGTSAEEWTVKIRSHVLQGDVATLKRCVDWYITTNKIPNVSAFKAEQVKATAGAKQMHLGYVIKNDTGKENEWYSFVQGRLLKGTLIHIQSLISKLQQQKAALKKTKQ